MADKDCQDYKSTLVVEQRVKARWQALIEKKYESAYTYLANSYKDAVTLKEYEKSMNPRIEWKGIDITRTRCDEAVCEVHVTANYYMPPQFGLPQGVESKDYSVEKWIFKDGEWWYLPPLKE